MKKILIFLLPVLLLCGCTPQVSDYTLPTVSTPPETTVPPTDTTQTKEYREYTTYPVEHPTDNVSGDLWYEENALVVSCYDTDLRRKVVLCSQPSCTHSNRDCAAYLGGSMGTLYVVRGDTAYALMLLFSGHFDSVANRFVIHSDFSFGICSNRLSALQRAGGRRLL